MTKIKQTEKLTGNDRFEVTGLRKLMGKAAAGLLVVEPLNNPELTEFRRDQCWECPNRDPKNLTCNICKCFLEEKTLSLTNRTKKFGIEITHCPIGNWNDIEIVEYYKSLRNANKEE